MEVANGPSAEACNVIESPYEDAWELIPGSTAPSNWTTTQNEGSDIACGEVNNSIGAVPENLSSEEEMLNSASSQIQPPPPPALIILDSQEDGIPYTYSGSSRTIVDEFLKLSIPDRVACIKQFWSSRQNTFYFPLRHIRDLVPNAQRAMTILFDGSTPQRKLQIRTQPSKSDESMYECGYWWPGMTHFIKAKGCTENLAKQNAALESLKVLLSENEFILINVLSGTKLYVGMSREQLYEALFLGKYAGLQPATATVLNPVDTNRDDGHDVEFFQWGKLNFLELSQRDKEDVLLKFWSPFFDASRPRIFPRLYNLFGLVDIDRNAAEAFIKLFSAKETFESHFIMSVNELQEGPSGESKFRARFKWNVNGLQCDTSAEGLTPDAAKNSAGIKALKVALGHQYEALIHMSQKFFYVGVNTLRVQNLLQRMQSGNEDQCEDGPSNPPKRLKTGDSTGAENKTSAVAALEKILAAKGEAPPKYEFSDAFSVLCTVREHSFESIFPTEEDAKNMAAFQALEFLWGGKLPI